MSLVLSTQSLSVVLFLLITLVFSARFSMIPSDVYEVMIELSDPDDWYSLGMTCSIMKQMVRRVLQRMNKSTIDEHFKIAFLHNTDQMSEMLSKLLIHPNKQGALLSFQNGILVRCPPSDYSNSPSPYTGQIKMKKLRVLEDGLFIDEVIHPNKLLLKDDTNELDQILDLDHGEIYVDFKQAKVVNDDYLLAVHEDDLQVLHLYQLDKDGTMQKTDKTFILPYPVESEEYEGKEIEDWYAQMDADRRFLTVLMTHYSWHTHEMKVYDMETAKEVREMSMEMGGVVQSSDFFSDLCIKRLFDNLFGIEDTRNRNIIRVLPLKSNGYKLWRIYRNRYLDLSRLFKGTNQWIIWDLFSSVIWKTGLKDGDVTWFSDDLFIHSRDGNYNIQSVRQLGIPVVSGRSCDFYNEDITSDEELIDAGELFDYAYSVHAHRIVQMSRQVYQMEFQKR